MSEDFDLWWARNVNRVMSITDLPVPVSAAYTHKDIARKAWDAAKEQLEAELAKRDDFEEELIDRENTIVGLRAELEEMKNLLEKPQLKTWLELSKMTVDRNRFEAELADREERLRLAVEEIWFWKGFARFWERKILKEGEP